jgi:hypothetical protein
MKTVTKLITASACGLILAACGGGGDNNDNPVSQGAIAACFTVPGTVSFEVNTFNASGMPAAGGYFIRTVGPGTFNGQAATQSETVSYVQSSLGSSNPIVNGDSSVYWAVTDSGIALLGQTVTGIGQTPASSYTANPAPVIPLNMQPGQSVSLPSSRVVDAGFDAAPASLTLVGLETLTLSGTTFSNVCHFQVQGTPAGATSAVTNDLWYASNYGEIQVGSPTGSVFRYSGDSN